MITNLIKKALCFKNYMKQNLGKLDRIFRFILGILWIGPMAPQFETGWINVVIFIIALIALVESFLGYCMLHSLFNINNKDQ
jgi:hypothetical protein